MASATCYECGWDVHNLPTGTGTTAWETHRARVHGEGRSVVQSPGVTFHEQALLALRSLAETGRPFTVGEAHPMVSVPPTNPRTDWEVARKEVWQGTYAVRRAVA